MARMPLSGSAMGSLYERLPELDELIKRGDVDPQCVTARECVTTLDEIIAKLGLHLSPDDTHKVREDLGDVIGRAAQEEARLQVAAVQKTLGRVARTTKAIAAGRRVKEHVIKQVDETLRGRETGFHKSLDTIAANEIWKALAGIVGAQLRETPGSSNRVIADATGVSPHSRRPVLQGVPGEDEADAMMSLGIETDHPREIAEACRIALDRLKRIVGKPGQPAIDWYPDFVCVLKFIAAKNGIKPTISTNPITNKRQGRFLALATAIEQLLPLAMRSPTDEARAQRLKRCETTDSHNFFRYCP